jgi:hypothetical protein
MIHNVKELQEHLQQFLAPDCRAVVNPCPVKVGGDKDGKMAIVFYFTNHRIKILSYSITLFKEQVTCPN